MTVISLPADCTREAALTLLAQVRGQGPGEAIADVAIDASAVETVGQAMIQVLLVVLGGRPLLNPSARLADTLRRAGLGPDLLEGATR